MTDHTIRDTEGAAIGIDWFALATEITTRPVPNVSEDNK
jgi:hypothetical protein